MGLIELVFALFLLFSLLYLLSMFPVFRKAVAVVIIVIGIIGLIQWNAFQGTDTALFLILMLFIGAFLFFIDVKEKTVVVTQPFQKKEHSSIEEEQKKSTQLKVLLEKLEERFAIGEIDESLYKEFKEKYNTQFKDLIEIELLGEVGLEQPAATYEEQKNKLLLLLENLDERFIHKEISERLYKELKEKYTIQLRDISDRIVRKKLLIEVGLQVFATDEEQKKKLEFFLEKLDIKFAQGEISERSYKEFKEMHTIQLKDVSDKLFEKRLLEEVGLEQPPAIDEVTKGKLEVLLKKLDESFVHKVISQNLYRELEEKYTTQLQDISDRSAKKYKNKDLLVVGLGLLFFAIIMGFVIQGIQKYTGYDLRLNLLCFGFALAIIFGIMFLGMWLTNFLPSRYKPKNGYIVVGMIFLLAVIIMGFVIQQLAKYSRFEVEISFLFYAVGLALVLGIIMQVLIGLPWVKSTR